MGAVAASRVNRKGVQFMWREEEGEERISAGDEVGDGRGHVRLPRNNLVGRKEPLTCAGSNDDFGQPRWTFFTKAQQCDSSSP